MAEQMKLSFLATTASKIDELPIVNGQFILIKDINTIAVDMNDKRTKYEQIITLASDSDRSSILAPVNGVFYFVVETNSLWKYDQGWKMICSAQSTIPTGGSNGQILKKKSDSDYDVEWQDDTGGSIGVEYDAEQQAIVFTKSTGGGNPIISVIVDNPSYFVSETANVIQKLSQLRKPNTLFIIFITDSHIYTSSNNKQYFDEQMASIKAVSSIIKPDLLVHGGDMTNGSEAKATTIGYTDSVVAQLKEVAGNDCMILIGNHDGNCISEGSETQRVTESEMLSMYRSWDDGFTYPEGKLYGYKDYNDLGIRVIRMHSYMGDNTYGGLGSNWGYPNDEKMWFQDTALNTSNDILILSHQTLSPILQGYKESQNIPYNGTAIQQLIDSWQNENRKCIGVICGHTHWDYVHTGKGDFTVINHETKTEESRTGSYGEFYEYTQGLCNYLTTSVQEDATPVSSYRDVVKGAITYGRKVSTDTQALWTAVVIDKANRHIDFVRFGAGNDISMSYVVDMVTHVTGVTLSQTGGILQEGQSVDLVATVSPENASNKSVTWESNDTQVATVSNGHVVAVKAGDCTITVKTVDGNKTATYNLTVKEKEKVNVLLSATESDGSPYNGGTGYKEGYRLNSSGNESAQSGAYVTGFIPCSSGQTLEINGFYSAADDSVSGANYCYIAAYDSNKTLIKSNYTRDWFNTASNKAERDENNYLSKITLNIGVGNQSLSNMAYVRISGVSVSDNPSIYIS